MVESVFFYLSIKNFQYLFEMSDSEQLLCVFLLIAVISFDLFFVLKERLPVRFGI